LVENLETFYTPSAFMAVAGDDPVVIS